MTEPHDLSRRGFLGKLMRRGASDALNVSPLGHRPVSFPVHRPPGAIAEEEFLRACTNCGDCIEACPHDAIKLGSRQLRTAAGTPVIEPDHAPCRMCSDLPCVTACGTGALRADAPAVMSTATIEPWACLAQQGSFCTVCHEQCPVAGATILDNGRPKIIEDVCTGCGVCRFVCPAPENAILLMPVAERPTAHQLNASKLNPSEGAS